ncbi:TetR family transcriptional regulator, partial [Micromonospora sp. WMMD736]|uniref:TetR family transcriptional regulator n=1 Tax=Micromonospora sp. WMMD736 TaxID=3404112 RepID=UPI003B938B7D
MGRPSKPLIKRDEVVTASLEIIDKEGLDAFTMPRLARHLGVRAPSLYHHFGDKNDILVAVARRIGGVSVIRPRRPSTEDWPEFFVALALNFRQAVLRHRNAAPVLLQHLPRDVLVNGYEDAARYLSDCGVPVHLHVKILDGLETLSVGAVLTEARRTPRRHAMSFPKVDAQS